MAEQALAPVDDRFWQRIADQMKAIIGRLDKEAERRVGLRHTIEQRWIADLLQKYGRYDPDTEKKLNDAEQSKLFINLTMPKTDAMEARLTNLLFPTDDKNWGIGPTPVPELTEAAKRAADLAIQKAQQAKQASEQGGEQAAAMQLEADQAAQASGQLDAAVMEGKRRAELMQAEIDDQLKQSLYHAAMRDVIGDAVNLGTGVCKGPVTGDRVRKGWKRQPMQGENGEPVINQDGSPAQGEYQLQMSDGNQPAMRHVDIWGFFPDMDVSKIVDGEGTYERHLLNKKKFRALGKLPGFDKDALRRLLEEGPKMSAPSYMADLRNITGEKQQIANDLYHVWEYSGPLDIEDMRAIALAVGDMGAIRDIQDIDPLAEVNAIIWFCQGELLKFAVYPYDSGECMYSVFNLVKDESSVFGYGVPWMIRDPQAALNAAWRAMMDNAGLASGPQIVVARGIVTPADGDTTLRPRKLWYVKDGLPANAAAFATFDIPMRQAEMQALIVLSKQILDEMAAMPQLAQGEQGAGVTKTAQGMALLMNSANVVFQRIVKNFDDDVTTPNIRRFYDWNMQFNPKEEIKGDYEVDARGSSVLLVREMQAQNLMLIAMNFGAHPVYGPMLKNKGVLKNLFKAQMIPADEVMLTDDEIDAIFMQTQQQEGADDPERMKLDAQIAIEELKAGNALKLAQIERDTQMMKLAETMNMGLDKIESDLIKLRETFDHKERIVAAEAAMAERTGQHAGGSI